MSATVSGCWESPGPIASIDFVFSANSRIVEVADTAKLPASVSGNGRVITSGKRPSKIGLRCLGVASVTNPAPARKAASLASAAAPVMPVEPATTRTRP